jgi:hypothetical protein
MQRVWFIFKEYLTSESEATVWRRSHTGIMGSNTAGNMEVRHCECRVLSGRCICGGPIPRPEESYRLWCVIVFDVETSRMRRNSALAPEKKKNYTELYLFPLQPTSGNLRKRQKDNIAATDKNTNNKRGNVSTVEPPITDTLINGHLQ